MIEAQEGEQGLPEALQAVRTIAQAQSVEADVNLMSEHLQLLMQEVLGVGRGSMNRKMACVILICFASGCAGGPQAPFDLTSSERVQRRCGPPAGIGHTLPLAVSSPSVHDGLRNDGTLSLAVRLSPPAMKMADTISVLPLVTHIPTLEAEVARNEEGAATRLLEVRHQILERIVLASLAVARTAAEADCEEERADQLADRLQEVREKRTRGFTILALLGSGVASIISGGLGLASAAVAAAVTEITGGSVKSIFGSAAYLDGGTLDFPHQRNLLKEVWDGPDHSSLMPPSVWRHLNQPLTDDPESRSLRETLIARWRQHGRLGKPDSEVERRRISLFFGEGGTYGIDDLRARAAMLDLLEADITLMSQDLELLLQEVLTRERIRIGSLP